MDEKVLVKSEQYNVKKLFKILMTIGIILSILMPIVSFSQNLRIYDSEYADYGETETYFLHQENGCDLYEWHLDEGEKCWECEQYEKGKFAYAVEYTFYMTNILSFLVPFAGLSLIGGLIYLWLRSYELTITDKRIYGKVAWGKRVDLPVDSVSATATISLFKGVSVSTSSGKISFLAIKNAAEIYKVVSGLLIERQQEKSKPAPIIEAPKSDEADQIKKYKELLDSGVITQEEFDAKKKQLLGL